MAVSSEATEEREDLDSTEDLRRAEELRRRRRIDYLLKTRSYLKRVIVVLGGALENDGFWEQGEWWDLSEERRVRYAEGVQIAHMKIGMIKERLAALGVAETDAGDRMKKLE